MSGIKRRESVDFVPLAKRPTLCLIERKVSELSPSPGLIYFQKKLKVPLAFQVVHQPNICRKLRNEGFTQWVISADSMASALP